MERDKEIEVRFLGIDKNKIIDKLLSLGAQKKEEGVLKESIFYDKELSWLLPGKKFIRIRESGNKTTLTYKNQFEDSADGTTEIEIEVNDPEKTARLLQEIGFIQYRIQEKKRVTFESNGTIFDIDECVEKLKLAAANLGLDWSKAVFENARKVLEKYYNLDMKKIRRFTFQKTV